LAFVTKMGQKHKSTLTSAIQVKHWQKTISIEEKLEVISFIGKDRRLGDIHQNVRFAYTGCPTTYQT
jgi:predicted DNA-binding protein with PD1-like motif